MTWCVSLCVSVLQKKNHSSYQQQIWYSKHTLYGRTSTCVDPEVETTKVKVTRL